MALRFARMQLANKCVGHRGRKILHASGWSLIAKGCAAANLLLSVPFVLVALGPEQFGAWATLVSLVSFAGFLDFGFGNGAMNLIASAHGRQDHNEVNLILRGSRAILNRIAMWLGLATVCALPLPWHEWLGLPDSMASASRFSVATVFISIALSVPLNLASRVQLGLGCGERAFRWQAIGQLSALAAVVLVSRFHPSLPALTVAAVGTPILGSLANSFSLRRTMRVRASRGESSSTEAAIERTIRSEGSLFFVLQLAGALAYSADLALISALRTPAEAGTYAIVQRLFSFIPLSLALIWAPLWPIYRQALSTGDSAWVMRTLRLAVTCATMFAAISASVAALGFDLISGLWLKQPTAASGLLLSGFVLWCVCEAAGTSVATFLNAASVMRFQVATACAFSILCFAGKAWVIAAGAVEWIPWVMVMTYLVTSIIPFIFMRKRILASVLSKTY